MVDRKLGKKLLKNTKLENLVFKSSKTDEEYKRNLYQALYDSKSKKFGWKHSNFTEITNKILEQNEFIKNPFEVEEGVFQCKAIDPKTGKICGSRRVFSYAKQDRSCDEGTSVYCQCVACKAKWRERG